ncbi:MAG: malto-oligosyltrehalose synthase [Rubricoccaceae bacterium]|nr:malto-oligosyltrehalose synthase [Rubricoccaceae bacterium]
MTATYRLQLQPDFGFAEAERLLPYLDRLGASHLYLSPVTEAREGSLHGYDVVDHNAVRADYGGRPALDRLLDAAHAHGLGVVLDWVPNHAGVGPQNDSWQDVLAYGPHSPFARYFDLDWDPLKPELRGKLLLPFLGEPYGDVLQAGELGVAYEDGRFYAAYYDNRFALAPATYAHLLEAALPHFERTAPYWDLKDLLEAYRDLDPREREKAEALRPRLVAFAAQADPAAWLGAVQGERLHALLERQCWRLSHWLTAGHEINYRRFFDINELVGLRMEDDQVFWDAHRLLGELLAHPAVAGVRIDHVDGLFDPHDYLHKLRDLGARHVWVEKILAPGETLPEAWPVEGATGYTFMNDVLHLLLAPEGEAVLDRAWRRFVPDARPWARTVHRSKRLVMETSLSSELFRLAYELDRLSEADYHTRDFTLEALREALAEVVAAVDRYRTYLPYDDDEAREVVAEAVHLARQRNPAQEPTVFDFVGRVVLGEVRADLSAARRAWVGRFQQYTAPVSAKGVEDTAFYRFFRLSALNEVGGEPGAWTLDPQAFHARARFRAHRYARHLLATATHDHKRGEDTRMRLLALADLPERWEETVQALEQAAPAHLGPQGPSAADRYLLYQTLAALWVPPPGEDEAAYRAALPDRLWTYVQKAAREAKAATSWINPDARYERDLEAFTRGVCGDPKTAEALGPLAAEMARRGVARSLTQLVLKLTTPGVPDLYQGTELLDLSLVDPDNRRPVDYGLRRAMLDGLAPLLDAPEAAAVRAMVEGQDRRLKLYVTARLLRLRRERPALFEGDYRALEPEGEGADGWLAFAREAEGEALVVLVPRFPAGAPQDVAVPLPDALASEGWTEWLTGTEVASVDRLDAGALPLPWAVLVRA